MDAHYFFTPNANRPYMLKGLNVRFEPVSFDGGVWSGAAVTQDEAELKVYQSFADDKNTGVRELTKAEYEDLTKKKALSLPVSQPSLTPSLQPSVARIIPGAAVVAEGGEPELPEEKTPVVENIEDVIQIAKVKPSEPVVTKKKTIKKKAA